MKKMLHNVDFTMNFSKAGDVSNFTDCIMWVTSINGSYEVWQEMWLWHFKFPVFWQLSWIKKYIKTSPKTKPCKYWLSFLLAFRHFGVTYRHEVSVFTHISMETGSSRKHQNLYLNGHKSCLKWDGSHYLFLFYITEIHKSISVIGF